MFSTMEKSKASNCFLKATVSQSEKPHQPGGPAKAWMSARSMFFLCLIGVFTVLSAATGADNVPLPFVSPVFGDNMVLQRGKPNPIWGWAKPGDEVRVKIADAVVKTVANADGCWQVLFTTNSPSLPLSVMDTNLSDALRFYRFQLGP
jgi:hypothetical protein